MVGRIVLLVAAAALAGLGVARTQAQHACDGGRRAAFAVGSGALPAGRAGAVARDLEDHCRGADDLVAGAAALLRAHAVAAAGQLAGEAVRREPRRRDSWIALWRVRDARGDRAGAAHALRRARALDPLSFQAAQAAGRGRSG